MERERKKPRRTKAERQGKKGGLKAGRFKEAKTEKERMQKLGRHKINFIIQSGKICFGLNSHT